MKTFQATGNESLISKKLQGKLHWIQCYTKVALQINGEKIDYSINSVRQLFFYEKKI